MRAGYRMPIKKDRHAFSLYPCSCGKIVLQPLNEPTAECFDDGFGLGMDLQLFVDIAEMKIDRAGRDL